jgi:antitoxin HigA-1
LDKTQFEQYKIKRRQEVTRTPTNRPPAHPGEILLKEFIKPLKISKRQFANEINIPYRTLSEIIKGERSVNTKTDLTISNFFNMPPGFWLNLQQSWDLYCIQISKN